MSAESNPGPLLLMGRRFTMDLAKGGLEICGVPLFVNETHDASKRTGLNVWDGVSVVATPSQWIACYCALSLHWLPVQTTCLHTTLEPQG